MAQNITIMGANYSDVPGVVLPKTGGGTALFTDVAQTTAIASDVANGKLFFNSSGVLTVGTASGGASNYVTGTFTPTVNNGIQDITIPYKGSGYPIFVVIVPEEGPYSYDTSDIFRSTVARYANGMYMAYKSSPDTPPEYGTSLGAPDSMSVSTLIKSSTSNPASLSGGGTAAAVVLSSSDPSAASTNIVKLHSKTAMSIYSRGSSYGFLRNCPYVYHIVYSE